MKLIQQNINFYHFYDSINYFFRYWHLAYSYHEFFMPKTKFTKLTLYNSMHYIIKNQINQKLSITNFFYNFTKIKNNTDKYYKVLTNQKFNSSIIDLTINNKLIKAEISFNKKGGMYFRPYINALNCYQQTITKGKSIIHSHCKLTHNYIKYIIIINIIQNWYTILNFLQCQSLLVTLKNHWSHLHKNC